MPLQGTMELRLSPPAAFAALHPPTSPLLCQPPKTEATAALFREMPLHGLPGLPGGTVAAASAFSVLLCTSGLALLSA